jgi:nucleotide-binding universal stress UspA family protein
LITLTLVGLLAFLELLRGSGLTHIVIEAIALAVAALPGGIAYSGSMESAKAMKRFAQMRLWPGVELKLMTFHPSGDQAYELLRGTEKYCRAHGFRVCHESNPGDPNVLLLAAATLWQADMIVMGNSARSMLLRKVLGDTLLTTLTGTKIPLFLAQ